MEGWPQVDGPNWVEILNVGDYLSRIGISSDVKPDYRTLELIIEKHLMSVPFENIDIHRSVEISLELDSIYKKIVLDGRGGYCYELNGLLYWLLDSIGYRTTLLSGRVDNGKGGFGPEFDHMLLLVSMDREYIVDVGFGDSSRKPVPLTGESIEDVSGSYRVKNGDASIMHFQKAEGNTWNSQFIFTLQPREMKDFSKMNRYQQTSPESHFTKSLICSMATPNGRITVSGNMLKITEGQAKEEREIRGRKELESILLRHFGIHWAIAGTNDPSNTRS